MVFIGSYSFTLLRLVSEEKYGTFSHQFKPNESVSITWADFKK
jgi:hypothetical protein